MSFEQKTTYYIYLSMILFADKIDQVDCEEYSDNYVDHYPGSGSGSGSGDWYEDGRNQAEGTTNNSLHENYA